MCREVAAKMIEILLDCEEGREILSRYQLFEDAVDALRQYGEHCILSDGSMRSGQLVLLAYGKGALHLAVNGAQCPALFVESAVRVLCLVGSNTGSQRNSVRAMKRLARSFPGRRRCSVSRASKKAENRTRGSRNQSAAERTGLGPIGLENSQYRQGRLQAEPPRSRCRLFPWASSMGKL